MGRQDNLEVWIQLHKWMMKQLDEETTDQDLWRGHRMIGVDGTCVSMSDEKKLVKEFGRCSTGNKRMSRFPFSRMVVAFNLKNFMTVSHGVGAYRTSEKALLRSFLGELRARDVLVLDRQFSGANLYWEYRQAGLEFITRVNPAVKIERLKVLEELGPGDWIVEMPLLKRHRRKNRTLPESLRVRLIRTSGRKDGKKETFWIVSSLLDPGQYPADEICQWYKKRWKVETLIEELKVWLGADILRSKTPEGIYKEIYARIMGMNLIHWLILKASQKYRQPPERISVSATLRLAMAYSLKMSTAPVWRLPYCYEQRLERIAFSKIPYRPDRLEPRMQKREPKNYPKLKILRSEWKAIYYADLAA